MVNTLFLFQILHHEYMVWRAEEEAEVGQADASPAHSVSESEDLDEARYINRRLLQALDILM